MFYLNQETKIMKMKNVISLNNLIIIKDDKH